MRLSIHLLFLTHTWTTRSCGVTFMEVASIFTPMISEGSFRDLTAIWEVDQGRVTPSKQVDDPYFEKIFAGAAVDYKKRLDHYNEVSVNHKPADGPAPERPMPPFGATCNSSGAIQPGSKIAPYNASISGLENALRDCRLEMIKIVREVSSFNYDSW